MNPRITQATVRTMQANAIVCYKSTVTDTIRSRRLRPATNIESSVVKVDSIQLQGLVNTIQKLVDTLPAVWNFQPNMFIFEITESEQYSDFTGDTLQYGVEVEKQTKTLDLYMAGIVMEKGYLEYPLGNINVAF